MAYIEWWNRTGPATLGERFGLNEISTRAKTLSPTKSYAEKPTYNWEEGDWWDLDDQSVGNTKILEDFDHTTATMHKDGGRIGLAQGTPVYTATADNFKLLDNLILNTKKTLNEIKSAFGGEPKAGNQGINKLIEAWSASSKDRILPKDRFKYYKFTADSPKVKEVIALFESGMSKKAIEFKTGISRKEIRTIFHQFKPEYIGDANLAGDNTWAVQKRRLKLIKEYTDYWKDKPNGKKMLEELNQKLRSIKLKNAEILTMSDEAILNNKVFKEAMNLDVKGLKAGEGINFNRYKNLTNAEYIAKVKAMAETNQFYQPEHLIAINKKNPASMNPKNIYTAVGKMGGQLEVLKEHLKNNPDVKITNEIKALLKNQNISLPKSETIASKALDISKKVGKYGIVRPIAGITLPGTQIIPETVKAIKEKRLPDYNLTDPHTWVNAAFWNWAVKEWGFDKTVKKFGESFWKLSKKDQLRTSRNLIARGFLSPKALQVIGSRIAWPVAGAMSVYDAYKDYQRRKPFIEEQKELIEQGVVKEEEFDKEEPMFAQGGIASLMK